MIDRLIWRTGGEFEATAEFSPLGMGQVQVSVSNMTGANTSVYSAETAQMIYQDLVERGYELETS